MTIRAWTGEKQRSSQFGMPFPSYPFAPGTCAALAVGTLSATIVLDLRQIARRIEEAGCRCEVLVSPTEERPFRAPIDPATRERLDRELTSVYGLHLRSDRRQVSKPELFLSIWRKDSFEASGQNQARQWATLRDTAEAWDEGPVGTPNRGHIARTGLTKATRGAKRSF